LTITSHKLVKNLAFGSLTVMMTSLASVSLAQDAPIVQPGAPGQSARTLTADEATDIADTSYSLDDVLFMQNMIPHHAQAVEMAALVEDRTNKEELRDVAGRIDASQADEIEFMQGWLSDRGEGLTPPKMDHGTMGSMHDHSMMEGMATPEQMKALADAESTEFDRLFLELMIEHHEGAVTMVDDLTDQPGSAYDPVLYEFISDVRTDQIAEIERMNAVLGSLSTDPRATLSPGFEDAGQASMNLKLVASLPKPAGFFDPKNPSGLPPVKPKKEKEAEEASDSMDMAEESDEADMSGEADMSDETQDRDNGQSNKDTQWGERSPLLSFSNTDMAFSDDVMVAGSYHGFNAYKLQDDGIPKLLSSVVCPGGQGDVSIVGDLLIMSVEQTRGRVDCGLQGINQDVSDERFRGLRIFDVSNWAAPVQVGQVQTCRGSHTHSIVTSDEDKIIVYNSGTSSIRDEEELAGCVGNVPGDDRTALFRIDVVEIPVADPSRARIVDSPTVFADPETGRLAGLWQGGDHGDDTQDTGQTNHCHDITVFPEANLAAGACSGNGIIFDISDPLKPTRIDEVVDKGFAYWHSATFNNDGTKVLFTDEWGGGSRARCRAYDPKDWGADAIYDINNRELEFKGYYKLSAPQTDSENCVAHNGSIVPVPGRDIFAQAWYQGGLSIIDFTDSANPVEIAYFDRGPIHEDKLVLGGYWSTYWYDGKIYGTEIARGLDVFSLLPSEYLSENEIAAARLANQGGVFNPQQQFSVTWPADPVIALAYIDQLERSESMAEGSADELKAALDKARVTLNSRETDAELSESLQSMAASLNTSGADAPASKKQIALSDTLNAIAERLN